MSIRVRTDDDRGRMNAAYRELRRQSEGLFYHDGLLHFGVPPKVVRGYVEAAFEGRDRYAACLQAWFGSEGLRIAQEHRGSLLDRAGRAWAWKLDEIAARLAQPAQGVAA
jgi:hypothetical protein